MVELEAARRAYVRVLGRATKRAVPVLARETGLSRRDAGRTFAAVAALVPAGLARRTRRRPNNPRAAVEVARKFGRPADVFAPDLGLVAHLSRCDLSPRLGGLLGDAGPRVVAWIAGAGRAEEATVAKALAASAPLALGALTVGLESRDLGDWIATVRDDVLDDPSGLPSDGGDAGWIYRKLRRRARPWWRRWRRAA
jgi:hypothetical protein